MIGGGTGHEPVRGLDRGTEVDARAGAATLRAAPMNLELTVRADRRERAEKLRQARHGRAEDDVQVAVHCYCFRFYESSKKPYIHVGAGAQRSGGGGGI